MELASREKALGGVALCKVGGRGRRRPLQSLGRSEEAVVEQAG